MSELVICIIIFVASLVLYAVNVIPMALTSVLTLLAFVLTGCLEPAKALNCFANSTLIIYGSMYVLAEGLNRTKFTSALSGWIMKISHGSMSRAWLGYILLAALLTSLIPSPPSAFAIVSPLCIATCRAFGDPGDPYDAGRGRLQPKRLNGSRCPDFPASCGSPGVLRHDRLPVVLSKNGLLNSNLSYFKNKFRRDIRPRMSGRV